MTRHVPDRPVLTVARLVRLLKAMPPGAEVYVEGCDCLGEARGVRLDADNDVVVTRG